MLQESAAMAADSGQKPNRSNNECIFPVRRAQPDRAVAPPVRGQTICGDPLNRQSSHNGDGVGEWGEEQV